MNFMADMSNLVVMLLLVAFLTETFVECIKNFVIQSKMSANVTNGVAAIFGIVMSFVLKVSLFTESNTAAYYIGIVICGLVASRGANYVHNFVGNLPKKDK